jgi:hypothetical protein
MERFILAQWPITKDARIALNIKVPSRERGVQKAKMAMTSLTACKVNGSEGFCDVHGQQYLVAYGEEEVKGLAALIAAELDTI